MKAIRLIIRLQKYIEEHGDLDVKINRNGFLYDLEHISLRGKFLDGETFSKDSYVLWPSNVSDYEITQTNSE